MRRARRRGASAALMALLQALAVLMAALARAQQQTSELFCSGVSGRGFQEGL
jgi:hypothetical protein